MMGAMENPLAAAFTDSPGCLPFDVSIAAGAVKVSFDWEVACPPETAVVSVPAWFLFEDSVQDTATNAIITAKIDNAKFFILLIFKLNKYFKLGLPPYHAVPATGKSYC